MLVEVQTMTIDLVTVGTLARRLQTSPLAIVSAARRAGVHPRFTVNGCPYYAADDVGAIRRALGRTKART